MHHAPSPHNDVAQLRRVAQLEVASAQSKRGAIEARFALQSAEESEHDASEAVRRARAELDEAYDAVASTQEVAYAEIDTVAEYNRCTAASLAARATLQESELALENARRDGSDGVDEATVVATAIIAVRRAAECEHEAESRLKACNQRLHAVGTMTRKAAAAKEAALYAAEQRAVAAATRSGSARAALQVVDAECDRFARELASLHSVASRSPLHSALSSLAARDTTAPAQVSQMSSSSSSSSSPSLAQRATHFNASAASAASVEAASEAATRAQRSASDAADVLRDALMRPPPLSGMEAVFEFISALDLPPPKRLRVVKTLVTLGVRSLTHLAVVTPTDIARILDGEESKTSSAYDADAAGADQAALQMRMGEKDALTDRDRVAVNRSIAALAAGRAQDTLLLYRRGDGLDQEQSFGAWLQSVGLDTAPNSAADRLVQALHSSGVVVMRDVCDGAAGSRGAIGDLALCMQGAELSPLDIRCVVFALHQRTQALAALQGYETIEGFARTALNWNREQCEALSLATCALGFVRLDDLIGRDPRTYIGTLAQMLEATENREGAARFAPLDRRHLAFALILRYERKMWETGGVQPQPQPQPQPQLQLQQQLQGQSPMRAGDPMLVLRSALTPPRGGAVQAASMQASPEARWDELVYSPSPQRTSPPPMQLQPQSLQSMRSNDASSSQSLNDFLEGTSLADQLPTWKPLPSVWNTAQVPTFDPLPPLRSPPQREELPRRERRASPLPASVSPPAALAPSPYASPAPVVPLHAREQEPLRPQSEIGLWLEDMLNLRENVAQVASGLRILGVRQPADLATINYRDLTSGLSGNLAQFLDEKQMEILVGAMAAQRHARARGGGGGRGATPQSGRGRGPPMGSDVVYGSSPLSRSFSRSPPSRVRTTTTRSPEHNVDFGTNGREAALVAIRGAAERELFASMEYAAATQHDPRSSAVRQRPLVSRSHQSQSQLQQQPSPSAVYANRGRGRGVPPEGRSALRSTPPQRQYEAPFNGSAAPLRASSQPQSQSQRRSPAVVAARVSTRRGTPAARQRGGRPNPSPPVRAGSGAAALSTMLAQRPSSSPNTSSSSSSSSRLEQWWSGQKSAQKVQQFQRSQSPTKNNPNPPGLLEQQPGGSRSESRSSMSSVSARPRSYETYANPTANIAANDGWAASDVSTAFTQPPQPLSQPKKMRSPEQRQQEEQQSEGVAFSDDMVQRCVAAILASSPESIPTSKGAATHWVLGRLRQSFPGIGLASSQVALVQRAVSTFGSRRY